MEGTFFKMLINSLVYFLSDDFFTLFYRNMFPKQVAVQTILRAVRAHFKVLEDNPALPKSSLIDVYFVLYDPESLRSRCLHK